MRSNMNNKIDTSADCLFELSWETCNKVGGIHRVLRGKAGRAVERFGAGYFLIGPDLGNNPDFEETDEELWDDIRFDAGARNLSCRCGRWQDAPGGPRTILVSHNGKYDTDRLLFGLWQNYGVDSMAGGPDYIEQVLFATAAAEMVEILYERLLRHHEVFVAHFHDWTTAAGLLYLNRNVPEIATVFTAHATVLGRAIADAGDDLPEDQGAAFTADLASRLNVSARHSIETAAAAQADCLSAVSEVTAEEVTCILGRTPRVILPNGITINDVPECFDEATGNDPRRLTMLDFASKFLHTELPVDRTDIFFTSGRYDFRGKGIDLFLESLKGVGEDLRNDPAGRKVVAFLGILGAHRGISNETSRIIRGEEGVVASGVARICTHQISNPQHDPVWNACNSLNLLNDPGDAVHVICMPVYLDGYDGIVNLTYDDVIGACDLGVFLSRYEPWGYTPLDGAARCLPVVTTDRAGFGAWVRRQEDVPADGVFVLDFQGRSREHCVAALKECFLRVLGWTPEEKRRQRSMARFVAARADWAVLYDRYGEAYSEAVATADKRLHGLDTSGTGREVTYAGTDSLQPRYRNFSVAVPLPEPLGRLREIAYDLTWTWTPEIEELFARLDPRLWVDLGRNPVELLERVREDRLAEMAENETYLRLYRRVLTLLDDIGADNGSFGDDDALITAKTPVAYFSTEYGLHESLPIYSGGLGVLSGDHLKSSANLHFPLVGVGLLYKNGYFSQMLDGEGNQTALYPDNDFSRMPVSICANGGRPDEALKIHVDLPGRKLYAQAWHVTVGTVKLYLLDTAIPENNSQDMAITSRLYGADQRLRIEQEIMLGIGGVRLLEKLGIRPAVFHLNEGHSAFLLLERIRGLMEKKGLTFHEAREVVRASSIFTTHSPVEAANERFEESLMKNYFSEYAEELGISWDTFWQLGRDEPGSGKPFFMPVLAFNLCCASNAVSELHGQVARKMWKKVWSGFDEDEVPVKAVTNGVHMQSWVAPAMKECYERYLGIDWYSGDFETLGWERVDEIPDKVLWQTHVDLKTKMIDYVKGSLTAQSERQGIPRSLVRRKTESLDPGALIIGFARRFATYKRALMLFEDCERLSRLLNDNGRTVQVIFAGKAHPNDEAGKELLKQLFAYTWDERFIDNIFFIENYNLGMARSLVQGVDVWLNNPLRPREASGTSGMKVVVNGGLNLSILDGWWDEAYNGDNGWAFGDGREYSNVDTQNTADSDSFYDVLESSVLPCFFDTNGGGYPEKWLAMMKSSIKSLVPRFNTHRMVKQYYETMYLPAARRAAVLKARGYERARALAGWKQKISSRFSRDHIRWYKVRGFTGDRLDVGGSFQVEAGIDLGRLSEEEVRVELVIMESGERGVLRKSAVLGMSRTGVDADDGTLIYSGEYRAEKSGTFVYGIRIMPTHPDLFSYQEPGLVHWA